MSKTTIICWPACQNLMEQTGFRQHSALCGSDKMYRKYGDSAYAVDEDWLDTLDANLLNDTLSLQPTFNGPEVDFETEEDSEEMMII